MEPRAHVDESQVPSLSVIEDALQREDSSWRDRANSLDTKAGVILSAAGVIVAIVGTTSSIAALIGEILAIATGAAAVRALWPRVDKAIGPQELRDRYLTSDPIRTRLTLLNTRIQLHQKNEKSLLAKAGRIRIAALLLLGSALAILVSGIVNAIRG